MLHKISLTALLAFSAACKSDGPQITIYISDPAKSGMDYATTSSKGFVPYSQTDNFVCLSPSDERTLLEYCEAERESSSSSSDL